MALCKMKQIAVLVVMLLMVYSARSNQTCPGTNCNPIAAIVEKLFMLKYDFNCMYTSYLTNLTTCLCGPEEPCIGDLYNRCFNQDVPDKISCKNCSEAVTDYHIQYLKNADSNCYPYGLEEYRDCVCEVPIEACPGNRHNFCFEEVNGL